MLSVCTYETHRAKRRGSCWAYHNCPFHMATPLHLFIQGLIGLGVWMYYQRTAPPRQAFVDTHSIATNSFKCSQSLTNPARSMMVSVSSIFDRASVWCSVAPFHRLTPFSTDGRHNLSAIRFARLTNSHLLSLPSLPGRKASMAILMALKFSPPSSRRCSNFPSMKFL